MLNTPFGIIKIIADGIVLDYEAVPLLGQPTTKKDKQAEERFERLVEQMKQSAGRNPCRNFFEKGLACDAA